MDWEAEYKQMHMRLIELRHRCSGYRRATEHALRWLREHESESIHPSVNISHLTERQVWEKISKNKANTR